MGNNQIPIDSLIFDMDGTLWDAIDSYATLWNETLAQRGIEMHLVGKDLIPYMGKTVDVIMPGLIGAVAKDFDAESFLNDLRKLEMRRMPELGGKLYEGVWTGLEQLSKHYKLFMLSNCGPRGLKNFMQFTHTEQFFTDSVSYGQRSVPKSENMKYLVDKHKLKHAVYVGDTQEDCDATHAAQLEFVHVTYGFGSCNDAQWSFSSFVELTDYFLRLKKAEKE